MSNSRLILATLLAVNFSAFVGVAQAADPVTDAMQNTYTPYRVALFKTNSNAQDESRQAVLLAQQGWNRIVADYGVKPPVPYDRDPEFAGSLAEVGTVYARAAAEIERNELAAAHDTLEQVREVMAGIRQRNQVVVYSDHMNAYHAQMERVLIDGGKMLAEPNGLLQLTAQVGALDYLAGRLKSEAPADYRQNEEFATLYRAVEKSVTDLKDALFAQDVAKVKAAMGKIKGPYSKMFIKFG